MSGFNDYYLEAMERHKYEMLRAQQALRPPDYWRMGEPATPAPAPQNAGEKAESKQAINKKLLLLEGILS
jgi:hypothetical protein